MTKGDYYKVFILPIVEPITDSRENSTVYVTVAISVFHNVDLIFVKSIVVDAEWLSPRISTSTTDNPLSL